MTTPEFLQNLAATWNLFFVRKFPAEDAVPSAALFVLPGLIVGFFFALCAWTACILFGALAAGIAAAILYPLLYELLTNWTGLKNLTSFLELRLGNCSPLEALTAKAEPGHRITPVFVMGSLYLLRALAFGMIASHAPLLFLLIFTGAYLIRGELVSCSDGETEPLLELSGKEKFFPYLLTGAVFVVLPVLSFHLRNIAGAILIAAAVLAVRFYQVREIRRHTGRAVLRQIHIYGYGAELILLYTGMIAL